MKASQTGIFEQLKPFGFTGENSIDEMLEWLYGERDIFIGVSLNDYCVNPYVATPLDVHKRKIYPLHEAFSSMTSAKCRAIIYSIDHFLSGTLSTDLTK